MTNRVPTPGHPHLRTAAQTARVLGVSEATLRSYHAKGYVPAYNVPGHYGLLFDPDEAEASLARLPRSLVRRDYGRFGPRARVVPLPANGTPRRPTSRIMTRAEADARKAGHLAAHDTKDAQ